MNNLKLNYFFYFSYLGFFFNLLGGHFHFLGFSGFERSIIFGTIPVVAFIANFFWGRIADFYQCRNKLLIIFSFFSSLCLTLIFMSNTFSSYVTMAFIIGIFVFPLIPLNDSLTISYCKTNKKSYGEFRQWGTISFIASNLLCMILFIHLKEYGIREKHLMFFMPFALLMLSISAFFTKSISSVKKQVKMKFLLKILLQKDMTLFFLIIFFHNIAFTGMYTYMTPHLKTLNFSFEWIALCWAISPIFEVFIFRYSSYVLSIMSANILLKVSLLSGVVRWLFLAFSQTHWIIAISGLLHSFTFGGYYVASISILSRKIPENLRSSGQGAFAGFVSLAMFSGNMIQGYLFDQFNTQAVFLMSALCSSISLLLSFFLKKQKN